jgi:hypothetical protein
MYPSPSPAYCLLAQSLAEEAGFDAATARRLVFVRWLVRTGRLGADDRAPAPSPSLSPDE